MTRRDGQGRLWAWVCAAGLLSACGSSDDAQAVAGDAGSDATGTGGTRGTGGVAGSGGGGAAGMGGSGGAGTGGAAAAGGAGGSAGSGGTGGSGGGAGALGSDAGAEASADASTDAPAGDAAAADGAVDASLEGGGLVDAAADGASGDGAAADALLDGASIDGAVSFPFQVSLGVAATSNLYGAGQDSLPPSSGSGAGTFPQVVNLPPEAGRFLRIVSATGTIQYSPSLPEGGPDGIDSSSTSWPALGGLAGPSEVSRGRFLAGVFLTDSDPVDPAPSGLSLGDGNFSTLAPEIAQIFFIGDGRAAGDAGADAGVVQTIEVPAGATRLFLGFLDRNSPTADPGWYGDNLGQIDVTLRIDR